LGRIKLRRLLTAGLILILFLSLLASALGVAVLVRGYLWNRAEKETLKLAQTVERFLIVQNERRNNPRWNNRPNNRPANRGLRRFNRGPGQLLLLKNRQISMGQEETERDWSGLIPQVREGLHVQEFDGDRWLVLLRNVESPLADQFVIIRPWSPSIRLVRTLVIYQVFASLIVMALALLTVSYFASRLAKPLEELREKTTAVGKVQVEKLEKSTVLEISDLQQSFLDMSRRVDEAMASQRRFVADASHELKTPLTAIAGMLELLKDTPEMETEDRVKALQVAKKEADRMESLIADLLLLSRAQAKRSGKKSEVPLADVVQEQVETLTVLFPDQKFRLSGDVELTHPINPEAFSRVSRNLLENAARYAGGEPIEIHFRETDKAKAFSVKDRGPGIPEEKLANLFERFYRTDGGRARAAGGHGLGLAIVKALVEEAGGKIACQSVEGEGSEFKVTFRKS
jgi:signal transduction histidine kinase